MTKGYIIGFSGNLRLRSAQGQGDKRTGRKKAVGIEAKLVALAAWMKGTLRRHHDSGTEDGSAYQTAGIRQSQTAQVQLLLSKEEAEEKLLLYQKKKIRKPEQDFWKLC